MIGKPEDVPPVALAMLQGMTAHLASIQAAELRRRRIDPKDGPTLAEALTRLVRGKPGDVVIWVIEAGEMPRAYHRREMIRLLRQHCGAHPCQQEWIDALGQPAPEGHMWTLSTIGRLEAGMLAPWRPEAPASSRVMAQA